MFLSNTNFHFLNDSSLNPSKESTLQKRPITISIIKDPIKEREREERSKIESNRMESTKAPGPTSSGSLNPGARNWWMTVHYR